MSDRVPNIEFRPEYIPGLDGLRAIAVLMVYIHHGGLIFGDAFRRLLFHVFGFPGAIGVAMFLVLSGFLITRILVASKDSGGSLAAYYITRTARIIPLYWAVILLATLYFGVQENWLSMLTFTYNWNVIPNTPISTNWSVCVEEKFYLVWPLILWFLPRPIAKIASLAIIIAGITWAYTSSVRAEQLGIQHIYNIYFSDFGNAPSLATGCMIALYEREIRSSLIAKVLVLIIALLAWQALEMIVFNPVFPDFLYLYKGLVVGVVAVVGVLAMHDHPRWSPFNLSIPPLKWVADISYGVYLIHFSVFMAIPTSASDPWIKHAGIAVLVFGTSWLSMKFFEMPIRDRAKRWTKTMIAPTRSAPAPL